MTLFFTFLVLLFPFLASSAGPQFDSLSKQDVKDIVREFGTNFSHTVVAAPETDGRWGLEFGLIAGATSSPDLQKIIKNSGGNQHDFNNLYHVGMMGRLHVPFNFFIEASILPDQDMEDVSIGSSTFGGGWNLGRTIGLPFDLTGGAGYGKGEISFSQTSPVASKNRIETTSKQYWVGLSKNLWILTPFVKVGTSQIDGELSSTASILDYNSSLNEEASLSGSFLVFGAILKLGPLRIGIEQSQIQDTKRFSAKMSAGF